MLPQIQNLQQIEAVVTALLLVVVIWQFFKIQRLDTVRKHFYSTGLKRNLENLMAEHDERITKLFSDVQDLNSQTEKIRTLNKNNFQKVGFIRYSQFGEAGNLSFSLVILDNYDNGFIVSSLHGRDGARVYAKDLLAGKSKAKLTDEEQQALTQATNTDRHGSK